jgi:2-carboxy-1,4-naphthoquinone phytyltransferase
MLANDLLTIVLVSQTNPWQAALNPAIYSAAVVPVLVGTAVAFYEAGIFYPERFLLGFVGLVLIQAWINLHNDVFDAETGVDRNKPWSLVALTGDAQQVFWVGLAALGGGIMAFGSLAWLVQDVTIAWVAAFGCALGYAYQGPPLRLSYQGWGEAISFTCFGPIAVSVTTYAQTQQWSLVSFFAGLLVGTLTSLILYTHHFPQIEDDRAFQKFSPIVRWGTKLAAERLIWLLAVLYGLALSLWAVGILPWTTLLLLGTLPLALQLNGWVNTYHDQPEKVAQAMPMVISLHFWGGMTLMVGFLVGHFIP